MLFSVMLLFTVELLVLLYELAIDAGACAYGTHDWLAAAPAATDGAGVLQATVAPVLCDGPLFALIDC